MAAAKNSRFSAVSKITRPRSSAPNAGRVIHAGCIPFSADDPQPIHARQNRGISAEVDLGEAVCFIIDRIRNDSLAMC